MSYLVGGAWVSPSLKMVLLDCLLGMPAREKRERKVYMTVYVSPELKHVIDMLRGPINRSAFVEFLLWCGLEVLKHRIGKVLARKTSSAKLVTRSKKKPRF